MSELFRIAIVGSGPSGLSAAAHAAAKGISHVLLEKTDHLSDTIFRYQKGKHVMATPSLLVLRSDCAFAAGRREAVLAQWNADAEKAGNNVRYNAEAKAITGAKGDFAIALANGDVVRAETVVLAIGTQGNPNLMRCDGAAQARGNVVTLVNRSADFARAKDANVKALNSARDAGRMTILSETTPSAI